jgi:hypothetical protein
LVVFQNKSRKKDREMKKITLTVGCLLLFVLGCSFVMADETPAPLTPRFGVEGGINLSSFNGPTASDVYASRLGFVGGAFVNLPFSPMLSIQPELLYEQKGGKINDNDYRLDYVEIPVLLDVTLFGPLSILLGPAFSANVGSYGVATVNQGDVGAILGAQVNLQVLFFSGRYEVGLTDLNSDAKIQNGTFTILAGISFN